MDKQGCDQTVHPPGVIRGWDSQSGISGQETVEVTPHGVGWLRGTVPNEMRAGVGQFLTMLYGDGEVREFGLWFYDRSIAWANGASINYQSTVERLAITKGRVAVELPATALEDFDGVMVRQIMRQLNAYGWQATRVDVSYDDYERLISPRELFKQIYEPSLYAGKPIRADFSGFLRIQHKVEHHRVKGLLHDEVDFGRRGSTGSGKYLRIYDKFLESNGRLNCVRWELELADERARMAWEAICRVNGDMIEGVNAGVASVIGSMIGASVDFKKRTGDKNLDRLERYDWWQELLARMGRDPALLRVTREKKKVHKSLEYIVRQCSGTMQMVHEALGTDVFLPMLVDIVTSQDRMKPEHWQAIREYRNPVGIDPLDVLSFRQHLDERGLDLEGETDNALPEL